MDRRLREAWTKLIGIDDYEAHMALTGQAQANAELVTELFHSYPPTHGAAILFAGAGTGQLFEYVSPLLLSPFRTTFSDINPEYLRRLASRISNFQAITFETALDDVENSQLAPGFELVIAVLVLEHVDWRKAIRTICHLSTHRVFLVVQENPPDLKTAITMKRPCIGSMRVFKEVNPELLPRATVETEFGKHGFVGSRLSSRQVLDEKKMIAIEFQRQENLENTFPEGPCDLR